MNIGQVTNKLKYLSVLVFFLLLYLQYPGHLPDALLNAHAHNDYYHEKPLFSALQAGFTSIEADVILMNDTLFVGHDYEEIKKECTLRALYLEPLRNQLLEKGRFYRQNVPLTLLIDFKTEANSTYNALKKELTEYSDFITTYSQDSVIEKYVRIVISGNRPIKQISSEKKRHVTFDGRLQDLSLNYPDHLMWLVSADASRVFMWNNSGFIEPGEKARVDSVITKVHKHGKKLRFWAILDIPGEARAKIWEFLKLKGLDYINSDDIEGLKVFLTEHP